jgi:hypothetical protein
MNPHPITTYVRYGNDWRAETQWVVVIDGQRSPSYKFRSLAQCWGLMRIWRLI